MVALIPSLHDWANVIAVIGLVVAMAYILLGYWKGRRQVRIAANVAKLPELPESLRTKG